MADDEMEAMEEGVAKSEEEETPVLENDENLPDDQAREENLSEENKGEDLINENENENEEKEIEGDENVGVEGGATVENAVDEELEIRDEDEGRPVSSLSKKSVAFADPPMEESSPPKEQGALAKMIRGMWASREMLSEETDKQVVMKTTLRELILYWYFILTL